MSTPERQQDPGEHGYGGVKQNLPGEGDQAEHPLEDPDVDSHQDEPRREEPDPGRAPLQ